jgi:hypothetical protein
MNTKYYNEESAVDQTFTNRCIQSCKQLLAGIESVKTKIANEFQETLELHGQSLQLALNEAEALAWQTAYPLLLFPALALEKVQAAAAWQTRQGSLHQHRSIFAEAV